MIRAEGTVFCFRECHRIFFDALRFGLIDPLWLLSQPKISTLPVNPVLSPEPSDDAEVVTVFAFPLGC